MFVIRYFVFVLLMCFPLLTKVYGQDLSVSSYGYFGLGEPKYDNDVVAQSMGVIATAYEDPFGASLNFFNPAANTKVSTTLFSTNFAIDQMSFLGRRVSEQQSTFYFSNISLGFPISNQSTVGLGYHPYTGYYNQMYFEPFAQTGQEVKNVKGSGGLNSFHVFWSYKIDDNWSVGLKGNFLFGRLINRYSFYSLSNVLRVDRIGGTDVTGGMLYSLPLQGGRRWSVGATYGFGKKVAVERTDINIPNEAAVTTPENTPMRLPMSVSLGLSYGEDSRWMLSAQYNWQNTSEFNKIKRNPLGLYEAYRDSQRFALGGYWIPQYNSYKNYIAKVIYRGGLYYENTALYINCQRISDYGLALGVGLPIKKRESQESPSYLNLGFTLGQRGTTRKNLTKENYFNIKVGFTFGAKWFQKRIYD